MYSGTFGRTILEDFWSENSNGIWFFVSLLIHMFVVSLHFTSPHFFTLLLHPYKDMTALHCAKNTDTVQVVCSHAVTYIQSHLVQYIQCNTFNAIHSMQRIQFNAFNSTHSMQRIQHTNNNNNSNNNHNNNNNGVNHRCCWVRGQSWRRRRRKV